VRRKHHETHELRRIDVGDGIYVQVPLPAAEAAPAAFAPARARAWTLSPVAAALGAALGVAALLRLGTSREGVLAAVLLPVLTVLAAIDLRVRLLPNRILVPTAVAVLAWQLALAPARAGEWLLAAAGAAALLLVPTLFRPGGVGMGDVKLAALLGAALGRDVLATLMLGFLAMLPVAVFALVRRGAPGRATALPMGPFMALAATVVLLG
jgi:leader peptidase (prepilin peptidase)/N-methyltransferase